MYSLCNPAALPLPALQSTRLLDQVRERIRSLHDGLRTEQAYVLRIRAYIRHHEVRPPGTPGGQEVASFLNTRVDGRNVSASTHTQALCALLLLYRQVLDQDLPWIDTHVPRIAAGTVSSPPNVLAASEGSA